MTDRAAAPARLAARHAAPSPGVTPEPGHVVAPWLEALRTRVGSPASEWDIVDGLGRRAEGCTPALLCLPAVAALNHLRWPDGVADRSDIDHEPRMLDFLRRHPLP